MASLGIWLFGFSGFPNTEFVRQTAEAFGLGGAPDWVVIAAWHYPITAIVYRDAGLPPGFGC